MWNKKRVFNQDSQEGVHAFERSRYATFGKPHWGKCSTGKDGCFGYAKKCHKMRDCPNLKANEKEVGQAPNGGPDANYPRTNRFFVLEPKQGINSEEVPVSLNSFW